MKQEALTLLDLNALVRRSLEQCLPDEYWIQAEMCIRDSYRAIVYFRHKGVGESDRAIS